MIVLIISILVCILLIRKASFSANANGISVYKAGYLYAAIILFAVVTGLRWNVGEDYEGYVDIVTMGSHHSYYNAMELLPQLIVDVIHNLSLPFYSWFIVIALLQTWFLFFSDRYNNGKYLVWIFCTFLLLYFSFYLNGGRQGVALSCFLCAVTYISDHKWKHYLLFIIIGALFHKSVILWSPVYFLNRVDFVSNRLKFLLFVVLAALTAYSISSLLNNFSNLLYLIGYGYQTESLLNGDIETTKIGTGFGILLSYIRWSLIIIFIYKYLRKEDSQYVKTIYSIMIIAVCFNYAVLLNLFLNRLFLYPQMCEILLYPYVYKYYKKYASAGERLIITSSSVVVVCAYIYLFTKYISDWEYISSL